MSDPKTEHLQSLEKLRLVVRASLRHKLSPVIRQKLLELLCDIDAEIAMRREVA